MFDQHQIQTEPIEQQGNYEINIRLIERLFFSGLQ
jgi:hypothetical protein